MYTMFNLAEDPTIISNIERMYFLEMLDDLNQKNSNIQQRFSCLLNEWIAKK